MDLNFDCALLTAEQIQATDARAAQLGITPQELMLRAGQALTTALLQRYPVSRVLIFCGPGNNGGDGFVIGRLLSERRWPVTVCTEDGAVPKKEPARSHARQYVQQCVSFDAIDVSFLECFDLIIDAGFGVGLSRPLNARWEAFLRILQQSKKPIVAVDIPTGIGACGQLYTRYPIQAELTLALFKKKLAHVLAPGCEYTPDVQVCDIGLEAQHMPEVPTFYENRPELWAAQWQQIQPQKHSHKYTRGQVAILGGTSMPGAACLSALGAAVCGAGLVSLLVAPQSWSVYAAQMRSVMVHALTGLADLAQHVRTAKVHSVLVGPGAVGNQDLPDYIQLILQTKKPCVLDAEALNVIASEPKRFFPLLHRQCILTPHEGEFQRLFPHCAGRTGRQRLEGIQAASQEIGAVIVLKGAETLIALADGRIIINHHASPYLATAGSGDVLAGAISAFLAQGVEAPLAAAMAVWLHGHAGQLAGVGLIADHLPHWLIQAQQDLSARYLGTSRSIHAGS